MSEAKKKTLFDVLYAAKDAVVKAMQRPSRIKMIRRACERVQDELERKRLDGAVSRLELYRKLAQTDSEDEALKIFKQLANLDREIEEAEALRASVGTAYDRMFADAPDDLLAASSDKSE